MSKNIKSVISCEKFVDWVNRLGLIIISILLGAISIRFWEIDFSVYPDIDGGDSVLVCMIIKNVLNNGIAGNFINSSIGAPAGSTLVDVPFLDTAFLLMIWVLSWFVKNASVIFYLMYIIPFSYIALAMYQLLRRFQINRFAADVFAILMACAPYHFYRGLDHITLSNYYTVPLAIYLIFAILEDDWNQQESNIKTHRIRLLIYAILVGLGSLYYAFFGILLMCLALVFRFLKSKNLKKCVSGIVLVIVVMAGFLVNIIPKLVYGIFYGNNNLAGIRYAWESEAYGLKIAQMLLPVSWSRIPFLAGITAEYTNTFPLVTENYMSSLGVIGSIGFILLCLVTMYLFVRDNKNIEKKGVITFCALAVLCLTLFCTIGGFGTLFSLLITPQIRALNRVSIFILCFCFLAIAIGLNDFVLARRKFIGCFLMVVILGIGMFDQYNMYGRGWQEIRKEMQEEYQNFFSEIEDSVGNGGMVYQLPYFDFPEYGSYKGIQDYTPLIAYLLTDDVRWSYGSVKGRENVAKELYLDNGLNDVFVALIREEGYSGVLIDRYGYDDNGDNIIEFYSNILNEQPIISKNDRYYYFDISKYSAHIKRKEIASIETEWVYSQECEMYSMECNIESNKVYEINISFDYDDKPTNVWLDFYGGSNYDDMQQQKEVVLDDNNGIYTVVLTSGDVENADFYPVLFRLDVVTDTVCEVYDVTISELAIE